MLPRNILNTYYVYVCLCVVSYVFIFIHRLNPFKQVQATDYNNAPGSFSARAQEQCDVKRPRDQYKMSQMCFLPKSPTSQVFQDSRTIGAGVGSLYSTEVQYCSIGCHWLWLCGRFTGFGLDVLLSACLSMSQHVSA